MSTNTVSLWDPIPSLKVKKLLFTEVEVASGGEYLLRRERVR